MAGTVFVFGKKIFLFLLTAAVSILMLSSVSFTYDIADISESFSVRAGMDNKIDGNTVVKMVANIEVRALTGSIAEDIEDNLIKASKDIYNARLAKAEEERKAREAKESSQSRTYLSGSGANLSGVEAEIFNLINSTRAAHGLGYWNQIRCLLTLPA